MQYSTLILVALFPFLIPVALAQQQPVGATEDTTRHANDLLKLSAQQNFENHAVALQTAQQALVLWQSVGDKGGIARTYDQIGRCYLVQSKLPDATKNYEQALQIWQELNNNKQVASTLIMLGFIEVRKGEWSAAISLLTQAQSLLEENDASQLGQISAALADIFNESGLPKDGLIHTRRALEYYRRTPDERDDKRMILDIGKSYFLLGKYSEALAYIQQALDSFAPDNLDSADCHESLGRVYSATGQLDLALEHLQAAIPVYERIGNPAEAARARALVGQVYYQMGQLERARHTYQQALSAFQRLSDQLNESALHYALGRLELKRGNYDEAEQYLRHSIDETENIRRIPASRDLTAAFSATVHDRYAGYIECLMHKHQINPSKGFDVLALETSELARARSLAEFLRDTQITAVGNLEPELAAQEKTIRQSQRIKEDYRVALLARNYKKEELDALDADLQRLEKEYKQVSDTIRERYPSFEQITRPTALTLSQIQAQVLRDDQSILLEYSLGLDRSFLWAVTRTQVSSFELPARAEIEDLALQVYGSLTAYQPKSGETPAQRNERAALSLTQLPGQLAGLSEILLRPVAAQLGTKRLIIVADGALQYIPFQALTLRTPGRAGQGYDTGRALLWDHEIVNEPSASTLALLISGSAQRAPASGTVAVLADPVFAADDSRVRTQDPGSTLVPLKPLHNGELLAALRDMDEDPADQNIPRLLESRVEADAIMSIVPWRTGFRATDFNANREIAARNDLGQYRIVHFATHAFLNNKHPQFSGIVLSLVDQNGQPQDGFLRLQDIYNLKLPVDLVVLSACQTGLGKDVKGEGLIGLTRGFMYAGASGVVASLWKVDDEATAALMKHFYAGMFEQGLSPAAALRQAQLAVRREKRWQEPYYWAGFVIQGQYANQRPAGFQLTPAVKVTALVGATMILFLSGFFVFWRRRRRNL